MLEVSKDALQLLSDKTHLATGFAPFSGGALGRYRTRGYSGFDVDVGSHPNNVGLRFNPMDTKSLGVAGIGGNFLWDDVRTLFSLEFVLTSAIPLRKTVSLRQQLSQRWTHLGQLSSVSDLQGVSCTKARGRRYTYSPSICC